MTIKEFETVFGLTAGGIAVLLVVLSLGLRAVPVGVVRYTLGARLIGAAMTLTFPGLIVGLALHDPHAIRPEDTGVAIMMTSGFALMGGSIWLEFARVRHTYDASGFTYRTPWSPTRRVEWTDVSSVEWRPMMQWLDVVAGKKPHHLSTMLGGLPGFADAALRGVPAEVLASSPEGTKMLERIRDLGSPLIG